MSILALYVYTQNRIDLKYELCIFGAWYDEPLPFFI